MPQPSALQQFMADLHAYGVTDLVGEVPFAEVADQLIQPEEETAQIVKKIIKESDVYATPDLPFGQNGAPAPVQSLSVQAEEREKPRTQIKQAAVSAEEVALQLAALKESLKQNKPQPVKNQQIDKDLLQKSICYYPGEDVVLLVDMADTDFPKGKRLAEPEQQQLFENIAKASGFSIEKAHFVFVSRQKADGGFYTQDEENYLSEYLLSTLKGVDLSQTYAFGQQSLKLVAESLSRELSGEALSIKQDLGYVADLPALLSMLKQPNLKKNAWLKILSLRQKSTNISSLTTIN